MNQIEIYAAVQQTRNAYYARLRIVVDELDSLKSGFFRLLRARAIASKQKELDDLLTTYAAAVKETAADLGVCVDDVLFKKVYADLLQGARSATSQQMQQYRQAIARLYAGVMLDIDGTIIESSDSAISKPLARQLEQTIKRVPLAFATARRLASSADPMLLKHISPDFYHNLYLYSSNGAGLCNVADYFNNCSIIYETKDADKGAAVVDFVRRFRVKKENILRIGDSPQDIDKYFLQNGGFNVGNVEGDASVIRAVTDDGMIAYGPKATLKILMDVFGCVR